MRRGTSRRSAIVADRRPLERGLARFFLEERGLQVVGEAATMADVLLQVQELRPDIVILHERLALDHDPAVVAQIRRISPRTSIVLLAGSREALPPDLILLADTVVEDGIGLTELGVAVAGPSGARPAIARAEVQAPAVASPARRPGGRWYDRLQGLAVASIIALAFVIARDMTTPPLVPTVVARAHMDRAWDSLAELESALPSATTEQIVEIASVLIDERAAAEAGGVSLESFDQALREGLASLWPSLPMETQTLLVALFQELFDDSEVAPLPSPSPGPSPSPEPTPPPDETTTPPPVETTTPPPVETTTPPPVETTTTPPEETTTTPPEETTTPPPEETTTPPPEETTTPPPEETTTPPPTETTTPPPSETTTPPPTETTTPPPSETTTPPPGETTTPPPTETTTPPPTETTTPPPTETTTPPPTETQSASLVLIPFAFTLMLAISGWARRRSHRSPDGPD